MYSGLLSWPSFFIFLNFLMSFRVDSEIFFISLDASSADFKSFISSSYLTGSCLELSSWSISLISGCSSWQYSLIASLRRNILVPSFLAPPSVASMHNASVFLISVFSSITKLLKAGSELTILPNMSSQAYCSEGEIGMLVSISSA